MSLALQRDTSVVAFPPERALRIENEELRETVRQLRALLAPVQSVPAEWKLSPSQYRLFCALLVTDVVSVERGMAVVRMLRHDDCTSNNLSVHILQLRRKLKPFGVTIETRQGIGYALKDRLGWRGRLS